MSPLWFGRKDEPEGDTIIMVSVILVSIFSLSIISNLQLPPKVMAQTPSEAAKVLVDDVIQDLKYNDTTKAKAHLGILNQQLQNLGNSSSVQSAKVLLDDTNAALKKNDIDGALAHLSLIKQLSFANNTIGGNIIPPANTTKPLTTQIVKNKANHSPEAFGQTIVVDNGGSRIVDLRGNDIDGDPITFSIKTNPTHGELKDFNSTTGLPTYYPQAGYAGNDSFSFQVTDNHNTTSNIAHVSIVVGNAALLQTITDTNNNLQVTLQAPDGWNSGTASSNIHSLHNWRSYAVAAANDDLSAFFVIINLPPLAKFGFLPFDANLLSQYVTLNSQYDLNFNGYLGHAYSISVSSEQLSRLQSFLPPPISKEVSAVIITTEQKGEIYLIIYGTDLGRMGDFQETFQNMLNSVSFQPLANITR